MHCPRQHKLSLIPAGPRGSICNYTPLLRPPPRRTVEEVGRIEYDASREALYRPATRASLFEGGASLAGDALCAECSRLAYLSFERPGADRQRLIETLARAGLSQWEAFHDAATGTEAFAAIRHDSGEAFVVFRGTAPGDIRDLGTDLNARPVQWAAGGNVHAGFAAAFASVQSAIESWIAQHAADHALTVTGHSLGAALATLAMSRWRARRLVTFGCPRVGDASFVATIDVQASIRYVGCCDLVCAVPPAGPWYCDAGAMRYIDRNGIVRDGISTADTAIDRGKARREYFSRHAWRPGNVVVRELADHAPINYVRALVDF